MAKKGKAIVINEKDTVAVALEALPSGEEISVATGKGVARIRLVSDIPMGHKFALVDMEEKTPVIKYGEPIGLASAKILKGQHVHVHNVSNQ